MFNKNRVQKYALRSSWSILIIRDFDSRPNKCGKTGRTVYGSFFMDECKEKYYVFSVLQGQIWHERVFTLTSFCRHCVQSKRSPACLLSIFQSFCLWFADLAPTAAPQSCVSFARRSLPFYWHFSNFSPHRTHPHLWGDARKQRFADHYLIVGIEKARPKPLFSKYFHCATMMPSVQRRVNSDKAIDRIGNAASGQKRNKPLLFKDLTSYPNRRSSIYFLATNS